MPDSEKTPVARDADVRHAQSIGDQDDPQRAEQLAKAHESDALAGQHQADRMSADDLQRALADNPEEARGEVF